MLRLDILLAGAAFLIHYLANKRSFVHIPQQDAEVGSAAAVQTLHLELSGLPAEHATRCALGRQAGLGAAAP